MFWNYCLVSNNTSCIISCLKWYINLMYLPQKGFINISLWLILFSLGLYHGVYIMRYTCLAQSANSVAAVQHFKPSFHLTFSFLSTDKLTAWAKYSHIHLASSGWIKGVTALELTCIKGFVGVYGSRSITVCNKSQRLLILWNKIPLFLDETESTLKTDVCFTSSVM